MPFRQPLSPVTNSLSTPKRPVPSKYHVSPSTSRSLGIRSPASAVSTFTDQDESRQRKERRRVSQGFDLHRKPLGSPSSAGAASPRQADALSGLTNAQLSCHYSDCIKLSAENKINAKNAFGLHLIDYMTELLKKKELESFQVASSTLDASVKIYAGRVDFIHTQAYKVLNGLGGGKAGNDADTEDTVEGEEANDAAKSKKKRKGKAATIETNLKNINVDKFDLEFEVDPMFQIMSTAFDEGGARGLLLNRLQCFDSSQLLVLDSSTVVNVVEDVLPDSQSSRQPVSVADVKEMLENLNLDDKQICPSMASFRFCDWNGDTSLFPRDASRDDSAFAFDRAAEPEYVPNVDEDMENFANTEVDDGGGVDDDDQQEISSASGDGSSFCAGDMRTAEFVESAFSDLTNGSMGKLRQILALQPSDYSYFNKVLTRTWAGPAHWKVAPASKKVPGSLSEDASQKKRQRKAPLRLSYDANSTSVDKMFQTSKRTTITTATWAKYTKKKTTLPVDQRLDLQDSLFRLFERPKIMMKRLSNDSVGVDGEIENYDYNNKYDVENFCPGTMGADDNDDDSSTGFDLSNETNFPQGSQAFDISNEVPASSQDVLVAAPHRVAKIDIKFAKTAKRVDVKKLKTTIWHLLANEKKEGQANEPIPALEDLPPKMVIPNSFDHLKEELPCNISAGMAKNVTVQTLFACLLHITNERTLKLKGTDAMDDIIIAQDE